MTLQYWVPLICVYLVVVTVVVVEKEIKNVLGFTVSFTILLGPP